LTLVKSHPQFESRIKNIVTFGEVIKLHIYAGNFLGFGNQVTLVTKLS